ncbi:class I SAM-dependent methyltransferase [Gordonia sp. TBRC 11910]|uniref:Class I SAM-dependent methyltransferase n=1 Tax=Gordonia asplenii TaxID=2725283 RepID=A0A848KT12_9ACTN|nr:class I SAM-dependent methyltransferase [Gordonia asplenii]NMO01402.1 class I SAM-dependent methyltransferase [Gordonia asplenii]
MGYQFTIDDVDFLTSRHGAKALENVTALELSASSMISDVSQVKCRYAPREAALIETVRYRRRARVKLRDAQDMLFTDDALQQATPTTVASLRAAEIGARFPGSLVADVTCSIGAEVRELVARQDISGVVGSDIDPVRLAMARHNVPGATLLRADALTPTSRADVVIADPARRAGGSRTFRIEDLQPSLLGLLTTYGEQPLLVKSAPGIDYLALRARFGFDGQVQITSLDGGVREACLWNDVASEGLAAQRATVLRSRPDGTVGVEEITSAESDDAPVAPPGDWIIDPDGAVVRAGLVRHYAARHGLWQLDPQIAYLSGDAVPPGERGFRVLEQVGVAERALRTALAARDCGTLEILVRGLDVDPDRLRKKLKLKGSRPLTLVMTRIGKSGVGFVCEAGVRA